MIYSAIPVIEELIILIIFYLIVKILGRNLILGSSLRGILDRLFIFIVPLGELPSSLASFSISKIATRLKDDVKISYDYFLVGNLVSVLVVIGYYLSHPYFI